MVAYLLRIQHQESSSHDVRRRLAQGAASRHVMAVAAMTL
jgi:hypothetical protein